MSAKLNAAVKPADLSTIIDTSFADFTIHFSGHKQKVHRYVLAKQSVYFKKCFLGDFSEATSRLIDLKDDDPEAVKLMLEYFYTERLSVEASRSIFGGSLMLYSAVYALADKYDVPNLKNLCAKSFYTDTPKAWRDQEDVMAAFCSVYTTTPSTDRGLRDVVVNLWVLTSSNILATECNIRVEAMLETVPALAIDIVKKLGSLPPEELRYTCKCGRSNRAIDYISLFEDRGCTNCHQPFFESCALKFKISQKADHV